ncbi:MAG: DUF4198 domain-containing protein [Alphaproteobacteria bacterium]|nr:DUF4198 domain-containing protein [Alphaproteobacteria bacterium]MBU0797199.1 DUF4198 domain-containing protein [Alphaproteobacteria bacterium]MBU0887130.1 DUF4198 domain-containing protein [Alphaproteobacteria bacterium]MBU1814380.1 DUF4198 domain-containing protein [Alphaproteobacteria bacterium]
MAPMLVAFALSASPASAHQVWIEQKDGGAQLYFGEFGDNLREVSPGLLDRFTKLDASLLTNAGPRALTPEKGDKFFALDAKPGKSESIIAAETAYPAFERKEGEKTIRTVWTPAARYISDFSARTASLALDIVPTGKIEGGAIEMQVSFKGEPLPKAKVEVTALSGWARTHLTDEAGKFSITLPWKALYVAEVQHTDKTAGERAGEKYDAAMYVTSLSFIPAEGLDSPPPPPAAKPN